MVLKELENGLHSSQAGRVLQLISETSSQFGTQTLLTTHSPALLNALSGDQVRDVVVCFRDEDSGSSRLRRLSELPGYASLMASGRLGDVVTKGELMAPSPPKQSCPLDPAR